MIIFEAKRLGRNGVWHTIGLYTANSIDEVELYLKKHDIDCHIIVPRTVIDIYEEVVV